MCRNTADFKASVVSAIEPDEWLKKIKMNEKSLGIFLRDFISIGMTKVQNKHSALFCTFFILNDILDK